MKKHTLLLLIMLALSYIEAAGQNLYGNVGPDDSHKPNASKGVSGSGLINIDNFTGLGYVNIPIYPYVACGVDLGVSLGYATKGIRVDELASSVGLGWTLNGVGSISREVNGLEDEVTLPLFFLYNDTSTIFAHDSLQGYLVPGAKVGSAADTDADDQERDVFHLDLGGRNIAFAFNAGTLTYQTYPHSEIKIELFTTDVTANGSDSNVRSGIGARIGIEKNKDVLMFKVTDEKGNVFFFHRGDYEYKTYTFETGTFDNDSGIYYATDKWNLTKMITYNGLEINYTYKQKFLDYVQMVTETLYPRNESTTSGKPDPLEINDLHWTGITSHVSRIDFANGISLAFDLDTARVDCPGNYRLKNIFVYDNYDTSKKYTYQFNDAYFNTPKYGYSATEVMPAGAAGIGSVLTIPSSLNHDSAVAMHKARGLRLKLKSIDKIGIGGGLTENYFSFSYNSIPLPYRFAPSQDFYGYFNNETPIPFVREDFINASVRDSFFLSIPRHKERHEAYSTYVTIYTNPDSVWGAQRIDSFQYTQACVLTSLSNCSGGKDTIIYAPYTLENPSCPYGHRLLHEYIKSVDGIEILNIGCTMDTMLQCTTINDGLVVGKVISTDGYNFQHTTYTEYTYDSAQRFNQGGYTFYPIQLGSMNGNVYTNFIITPDNYYNGSNHGFRKVTISNKGYAGQLLSKEICHYTGITDHIGGADTTWISKPTGDVWHNMPADFRKYRVGLLLKDEHFDENSILLSEENLSFSYVQFSPNHLTNSRQFGFNFNVGYWSYPVINDEMMRLTTMTSKEYSSSSVLTEQSTYSYDSKNYVVGVTYSDSRGDTYNRHLKYSSDYFSAYSGISALSAMNRRFMRHLLSDESWRLTGTGDSVLVKFDMVAPLMLSSPDTPLVFPASFNLITNTPLLSANAASTSYIYTSHALDYRNNSSFGTNLYRKSECTLFDVKSNCLELKINKAAYRATIWDTVTGNKLASAENAKYSEIAYTSFEGLYKPYGAVDYNKGNFDFDPLYIVPSLGITGLSYYQLASSGTDKLFSKPLPHNTYNITLWVQGPVEAGLYNGGGFDLDSINKVGSWVLYSGVFTCDSGDYVVVDKINGIIGGGADAYVDEVRLHPVSSAMTSYCYSPLVGMSSMTEPNNYITRYEYDPLGRLFQVKDMRGNILKKIEVVCNGADPLTSGGQLAPVGGPENPGP